MKPDFRALAKERSPEEVKAALLAYDALQSAQSKIDILFAYFQKEVRKVSICRQLPLDRKLATDLGIENASNEHILAMCIDAFIREFKRDIEQERSNATKSDV